MRRLKNLRDRSGTSASSAAVAPSTDRTAPSDDDKIRLQLQADVMHFARYVEDKAQIGRQNVDKLPQLVQLVEDAIKGRPFAIEQTQP